MYILRIMSTKAIQNILIGLIFASLLVPFIVFNSLYFPYIVGKALLFRTIVLLALILWGMLIYKDKSFIPSKNGVCISFLTLTGIYLISAFLGEDIRESIFNNFERMDGWITFAFLFVFFFITVSVMKVKENWNKLFFTQIISSLVLFLIASGKIFDLGINVRIDGTLGNPIYLAIILLFSLFFAFYLLFENYSKNIKYFLGASILINAVGVFMTGTRGAMLGIFVALVLVFILFLIKFWKIAKVRNSILIFFVILILAPTLLFVFKDTNFVKSNGTLNRLTQINIVEGTGYARFINWGIALESVKERPVFGWGHGGYMYAFDKHYDPRMFEQEPFFDRAHNIVLDTLIHGGILALLAYFSLLGFAVYYLFKNRELKIEQKFIFLGLLVAYFVQNLFVFDNITSYILFVYVLAFSIYYLPNRDIKFEIGKLFLPIFIIISIPTFLYTIYFPWTSNTNLLKSIQFFNKDSNGQVVLMYKNGVKDNHLFLKKALTNNFTGINEIVFASTQSSDQLFRVQTDNTEIKQDINNYANYLLEQVENELKNYPNSSRTKYLAGSFYARIGNLERAEKLLEEAVNISPNRQLYLSMLSAIKGALKKDQEQIEILQKIYELEKTNDKAWIDYVVNLNKINSEKFKEEILKAQEENKIERLIKYFDQEISNRPDVPQAYINKVVILSQLGMFEEAIKELEIAEQKFPEIKSQVSSWKELFKKGQLPK